MLAADQFPKFTHQNPYRIFIEGNLGAGKSTVLTYLKKSFAHLADCSEEPLEKWINFNGANLLGEMYLHPKEKSFILQSHIQFTMLQVQLKKSQAPFRITERSLLSEKLVFIQNLIDNKFISPVETDVLNEWFNFSNSLIPVVDEIIYLQTSPQTAFDRLSSRNRNEETPVSLEYISQIHNLYENWLMTDSRKMISHARVTVLDQNLALEDLQPILDLTVARLKNQLPPVTNY
jgi:deoxyadenosine/deoxycytidine kinase